MATTAPEEVTGDARLPAIGEVVAGKYRVESELGRGGMGVVFAASHVELGTRVAVKILRGKASPESIARFQREARAAAQIQSEHVARVLDTGSHHELPFMVLERLDGRDLGAELRARGVVTVEEACDYVIQACDGLADAHARGIVHRDVKPSNLFLARRMAGAPVLKILDFGISKAPKDEEPEESLTRTAALLGSPLYMSPEQIRHSKAVDARTDIWALGVVLYQLLTGDLPFRGEGGTSSTLASVMVDKTPKARDRAPHVPKGVDDVVSRCLEKSVGFRYRTVTELAMALAPFATADGKHVAARLAIVAPPPNDPIDAMTPTLDDANARERRDAVTAAGSVSEASMRVPRRPVWPFAALAVMIAGGLTVWGVARASNHPATPAAAATPEPNVIAPSAKSIDLPLPAPPASTTIAPSIAPPIVSASATTTTKPKYIAKPIRPAYTSHAPIATATTKAPPTPTATSTVGNALDSHQ